MIVLNKMFLLNLAEKYQIEKIDNDEFKDFSYYRVSNKKTKLDLILCNDNNTFPHIDVVLSKIALLEKQTKKGTSYLCIMPQYSPKIEMCTHCNGKSFVHFVFYDDQTHHLVYDLKIYYFGVKFVKQLIKTYQNCFEELEKDSR